MKTANTTRQLGFLILTVVIFIIFINSSKGQNWTNVLTDVSSDELTGLDGVGLDYDYNPITDSLYFKITCSNLAVVDTNFGVNIMINIPGGGTTFNFWGIGNNNPYHKLISVWVTGTAPSSYTGTIGIANAAGVGGANYTNLFSNNIGIVVNTVSNEIILSLPRKDFVTDLELGGPFATLNIAAATGSSILWGDDLYNPAATIFINTTVVNNSVIDDIDAYMKVIVYPNPTEGLVTLAGLWKGRGAEVELINVLGQLVYTAILSDANHSFVIEGPIGLYFLRIRKADGSISISKLIKH